MSRLGHRRRYAAGGAVLAIGAAITALVANLEVDLGAPPSTAAAAGLERSAAAPGEATAEPSRSLAPGSSSTVSPAAPTAAPTEAADRAASAPVRIEQLPGELQRPLAEALAACADACQRLGLPIPDWRSARIALDDARELVAREAELRQRILTSAMASDRELSARLDADPGLGLRFPAAERAAVEASLPSRFPGWPDEYVFLEESDGGVVRLLAVRVASDPVLRGLLRDHDALTGEYAWAVRAAYRLALRP